MTSRLVPFAVGFALLAFGGCESKRQPATAAETPTVTEAADWDAMKKSGRIRLIGRSWGDFDTLPSQGLSAESYRQLAEGFASRHGLRVEWLSTNNLGEMFAAIEEGRADIAISNITITRQRQQRLAFSLPLTHSREWVVGVTEHGVFGVAEHSAYVDSLAEHFPQARRQPVPANANPETFLDLIENGTLDATIMDEAAARVIVAASPKIEKLRELPELKHHAWAMRRDDAALKAALDEYLLERHVFADEDEVRDWPAIQASGHLRLLTLNTATTYYLWRGERLGYEYEMVQAFADAHGLRLAVVVAPEIGSLIEWLKAGRGDLIAAGLTATAERTANGLAFTRPYLQIRETFVTAGRPIENLDDLAGRRVTVNPDTTYAATLKELDSRVAFQTAFAEQSTEAILDAVAGGEIDVTLADSHRAELAATYHSNLALGVAFDQRGLAWAVNQENRELHQRLDEFVREGYRGYQFNVLYNKYFVNQRRMVRQREQRVTGESLSPYDHIVKPLAEEIGVDWRLVVSQMYQESGFDPNRVSFAGAEGLLQVLPRTAAEVGMDAKRLQDPEIGIRAGIRYLAWTRERFPNLPVGQQLLFALASYNAGAGHVRDGRRLAKRLGLNDSLWFDNVETAMLKLAEPHYARQAVHGYVRGTEVVRYVREIHDRYRAYHDHFRMMEAQSVDESSRANAANQPSPSAASTSAE